MEGNIAATYALIYHFLKQQSQNKAAEAVKKAAKAYVVLRDDIKQEGPSLEDIIKDWKTTEHTKSGDTESSSEDSESSDESSSEDGPSSDSSSKDTSGSESEDDDTSDSGDSSDDSDEGTVAKNLAQKAVEYDTSTTLSSAEEIAQGAAKRVVHIPGKKPTKDKSKGSESNTSDSDSSSESSSSKNSDAESSSSSSGSSNGSDSSDEDEVNENEKAPPNRTKTIEDKSSSTSESSSESEDESDSESQRKEDIHVAKKRKTSENGTAVATAVANGSQQIAGTSQRREKPPPKVKERFQRVKVQVMAPELLLNNGYEARGGVMNDYGERAHRDLIVTRGAGFRKEKNKKKRGSYRGGEITMENHSIKFDF